jgi:xylulokinase
MVTKKSFVMDKQTAKFLIGLDLGTSTTKGVLLSADGRIIADSKAETEFIKPREGYIEVDPELHYRSVCRVIRELADKVPDGGRIIALSMAAASGNAMLTDADGGPLINIISWLDQRATLEPVKLLDELSELDVHNIVGWPFLRSFPLAAFAWLKQYRAEVFNRAARCCMNTDWLIFRLTGKWVMDSSTATTFYLQDQLAGDYYAPFLDKLEIESEKLSELTGSGQTVGGLTDQGVVDTGLSTETLVVTGSFDHPAAARGTGVLKPGDLLLSCGTSWVGFYPVEQRENALAENILIDPFLSHDGGPWGAIFFLSRIGVTIDWYVDNLIAPGEKDKFRLFDELAAAAEPGAGGLKIDLMKPPEKIADSRENISRAVMEGAALLMRDKLEQFVTDGMSAEHIVMVGGPTNSPIWPQILADISGVELILANGQHAGALGAALLAGIGVGIYCDEAEAFACVKEENKIIKPGKNYVGY